MITRWVSSFVKFVIFVFDNLEHLLLVIVSRLAPWAAPLAPAYFVAQAIQERLAAPPWIAWAVGVTVEAVGVASTHITLEMYTYNGNKKKADPEAPVLVGVIVTVAYFVTGIVLTIIVKIWPKMVVASPAFFFLLAIVAYVTLALMSDQAKRVQGVADEKAEKRNKKAERVPDFVPEVSEGTRAQAAAILAERSDITGAELARLLGKSDSLGRRLKRELLPNPNGKEANNEH